MTFSALPPPIVVDASVAVAGALGDEAATGAWQRWAVTDRTLLAPAIVWPETANALLKRHRLTAGDVARRIEILDSSGLETADRGPLGVAFALDLAGRHGLSVYDATYLWLAIDVDGELATLDHDLAAAATAEGVPLALAAS